MGTCTSRYSRHPTSQHSAADDHDERDVRRDDAAPDPRPRRSRDQARLQHQRVQRPDPEHHQRIAEHAGRPSRRAPRRGPVLGDGQRGDVADAAPVEVAGGGVVDGVAVPPARERLVDDQPQGGAEPDVGALGRQERAVRAVVEHDEGPQQEARRSGSRARARAGTRRPEPGTSAPSSTEVGHERMSRGPAGCGRDAAARREPGASRQNGGSALIPRTRSRTRRRCPPRRAPTPQLSAIRSTSNSPQPSDSSGSCARRTRVNRVPGSTTSTRTRRGHCRSSTRSSCSGPTPPWVTAFVTSSVRSRSTSARAAAGSLRRPR